MGHMVRARDVRTVDLDAIAAGPGFPFVDRWRTSRMRQCIPCLIETTEETCFGCGRPTEISRSEVGTEFLES